MGDFDVVVSAGTLRNDTSDAVRFPHRWTTEGVIVEAAFTGAHLLHVAVAGCVLNDVYREADAHGPAGEIHDHTPVILPAARIGAWLNPTLTDTATIKALLADITVPALDIRAVSTQVNRVGTNTAQLIEPLDDHTDQTLQLSLTA